MKFLLIVITISIVLIQCKSPDNTIDQKKDSSINIEGHWILTNIEIMEEKQSVERYMESAKPDKPQERSAPVYLDNDRILRPHSPKTYLSRTMKDLIFSADSIYSMDYPLQMGNISFYTNESNLIKLENNKNQKSVVFNSDTDTLHISYLDHFGLFLEETYQKTTFNDSILNILKLYNTNFPLLAGTWTLVREDDYEGGVMYTLDFPYDIPETLAITKETLASTLYSDRSYYMLTNEKKLKYFLKYDDEHLILIPDNWYTDVDPFIHFRKVATKNVDK